jgi:hypothetical protein
MAADPGAALVAAKRLAASRSEVTGVDFGYRYREGRRQRGLGIRFHVSRKRPLSDLAAEELLPARLAGYPCDIVEAIYQPHAPATGPMDPMQPGGSVGNVERASTGTIGAFVRDLAGGEVGLLSNWHVLCGSTAAEVADVISQPGPQHLGIGPPRPVGRLLRWADLSHGIDAAVVVLAPGLAIDPTPMGQPPFSGVAAPAVGMRVCKWGVSSGLTHAVVDGVGGSFPIDYRAFGDERRWMDGVRLVMDPENPSDEISLHGDSGAVWRETKGGAAVALHFAGEDGSGPTAEYSLAHSLPDVLDRLNVDLVTV